MATVNGTNGNDFIHRAGDGRVPTAGYNDITGVTTGDDIVNGLASNDSLFGDDGNDVLNGRLDADALNGGNGVDFAGYADAAAPVSASLMAGGGTGEAMGDTYVSIEGLIGSAFDDTLGGDPGNNFLQGGPGADSLRGFGGFDYADYINAASGVTADLFDPTKNTGDAAGDTYFGVVLPRAVETILGLRGSNFDDTLIGDAFDNTLRGGLGADVLDGGGDRFSFDYAGYQDATTGVTANLADPASNTGEAAGDTYISIEGLIGSDFNDALTGDAGDNELEGGPGADALNGGDGLDFASYKHSTAAVIASLADPTANTGEAAGDTYALVERLAGSAFNDILIGDHRDNYIWGWGGADTIFAGGGNDVVDFNYGPSSEINGEDGDDTLTGGSGNDYMAGGNGNDTLDGGGDGQDSLFGGDGNDYLIARDVNNDGVGSVLDGGTGANQIYALIGRGNDFATGGEGADIIATGGGSDYIFGNAGDDTIVAGAGTDYIYGDEGNDFIYTDDAHTNSQDFVYVSGLAGFGTGVDTVADFTPGPGGDVAVILSTPGLTSFAQVQANMTDIGVYTVVSLSATDQLYLYNVDPFQLTPDNFLFL
ncbi:MAG: calcium-binding protein [Alphaproteobacteria bacterium]